jgi:hypothetical protein
MRAQLSKIHQGGERICGGSSSLVGQPGSLLIREFPVQLALQFGWSAKE